MFDSVPGADVVRAPLSLEFAPSAVARYSDALGRLATPYSVDANLWGRSIEAGVLEDPWNEPPEDAFAWTINPRFAPEEPTYLTIEFERGIPVALGDEGTDGSLVLVVKRLLEAGVRKDADRPARYSPGIAYADLRGWESYPVVLT